MIGDGASVSAAAAERAYLLPTNQHMHDADEPMRPLPMR